MLELELCKEHYFTMLFLCGCICLFMLYALLLCLLYYVAGSVLAVPMFWECLERSGCVRLFVLFQHHIFCACFQPYQPPT